MNAARGSVSLDIVGTPGALASVHAPGAVELVSIGGSADKPALAAIASVDGARLDQTTIGAGGSAKLAFVLSPAQVRADVSLTVLYADSAEVPARATLSALGIRDALLAALEPDATPTPTPTPAPEKPELPEPSPWEPSVPPAPTPEPSPAPAPEPSPAPKPEPSPTPAPEPSPVPTPEPSPAPAPEPTEPAPAPEPVEPSPTPEPSPAPIPTPTPAPEEPETTPEPKPSPSAEPTEEPSESPYPQATPDPHPSKPAKPAPTPEPTPEHTPKPRPTPDPAPTPTHTPTPEPTPTPTPEPTPTPAPEPTLPAEPTDPPSLGGGSSVGLDAPAITSISVRGSELTIDWTDVDDAEEYRVFIGDTPAFVQATEIDGSPVSDSTLTTAAPLTLGTYYFFVEASADGFESSWSPAEPHEIVLDAPAEVTATVDGPDVTVSWSPVHAATGYKITYSATLGGTATDVSSAGAADTSYRFTPPVNGTYYFSVTTMNGNAPGEATVAAPVTVELLPPTGVEVSLNGIVTWKPSANASEHAEYLVYRQRLDGGGEELVGTTSETTLTDGAASLTDGMYQYWVVAADGDYDVRSDKVIVLHVVSIEP